MKIPVIDLFAGPGGLGEGFSSFDNYSSFDVKLSIEAEEFAHKTLTLRSFYRQFSNQIPPEYYQFLQQKMSINELFSKYPDEAKDAGKEAWKIRLGEEPSHNIDKRIKEAVGQSTDWVLIGGPPCQAYSIVGRVRNKGIDPKDEKVHLYKEYYRILAFHNPPVFIMENVVGLLSAKINDNDLFKQILNDLRDPVTAFRELNGNQGIDLKCPGYKIYSLIREPDFFELDGIPVNSHKDFVIKAEDYGVPQTRHRVILLGVRKDLADIYPKTLSKGDTVSVREVINNLPRLRSGLSKEEDTQENWCRRLKEGLDKKNFGKIDKQLFCYMSEVINNLVRFHNDRGAEFIYKENLKIKYNDVWYLDTDIKGVCNHSSRSHIIKDLYRYMFVSCFGKVFGYSPTLEDFPEELLPEHSNVSEGVSDKLFADRFRVQIDSIPSKTITSHISKDGHYFIHPDPYQCRSFTVREAARIQTFPDNYYFCGSRTSQYTQVGNAVPPFLASQIAGVVCDIFKQKNNNKLKIIK